MKATDHIYPYATYVDQKSMIRRKQILARIRGKTIKHVAKCRETQWEMVRVQDSKVVVIRKSFCKFMTEVHKTYGFDEHPLFTYAIVHTHKSIWCVSAYVFRYLHVSCYSFMVYIRCILRFVNFIYLSSSKHFSATYV